MIEKINPSVIRSKQFITEALLELMTEEDFNSIRLCFKIVLKLA